MAFLFSFIEFSISSLSFSIKIVSLWLAGIQTWERLTPMVLNLNWVFGFLCCV
uniref:Uncharacterized protein n=1 Tax=Rhizophora mucronata TaxID=61149 RepID=A0A2P2QAV8_RHIMU